MWTRPLTPRIASAILIWCTYAFGGNRVAGTDGQVTLRVKIQAESTSAGKIAQRAENESEVVIWFKPLDPSVAQVSDFSREGQGKRPQVVQKDKSFHPHLTVIRTGTVVAFPNRDPFFHNVFSLVDGKRFDLGLYEAGTSHSVQFDHLGVSYIFCNIHPEMSAVVVALDTPYYGISDKSGLVTVANMPDGKYEMHVWYERSLADTLKKLTRTVNVSSGSRELGTVVVTQDPGFTPTHKNKYGQDYPPPPKQGYVP